MIIFLVPLADPPGEDRGAPVALAGVWGRAMDAPAQQSSTIVQQSWR